MWPLHPAAIFARTLSTPASEKIPSRVREQRCQRTRRRLRAIMGFATGEFYASYGEPCLSLSGYGSPKRGIASGEFRPDRSPVTGSRRLRWLVRSGVYRPGRDHGFCRTETRSYRPAVGGANRHARSLVGSGFVYLCTASIDEAIAWLKVAARVRAFIRATRLSDGPLSSASRLIFRRELIRRYRKGRVKLNETSPASRTAGW